MEAVERGRQSKSYSTCARRRPIFGACCVSVPTGHSRCRGRSFIPDLLEITTLADVRELIDKHLPAEYRAKFTWRQLARAAAPRRRGRAGPAEVVTSLRIVLQLEGIKTELAAN
jgi:hypothetical protein